MSARPGEKQFLKSIWKLGEIEKTKCWVYSCVFTYQTPSFCLRYKQVLEQESQLDLGISMCISTSASQRKSHKKPQVNCVTFRKVTHGNRLCFVYMFYGRNITQRQRELLEEFVKEEQGEYEKRTASGSSQWQTTKCYSWKLFIMAAVSSKTLKSSSS